MKSIRAAALGAALILPALGVAEAHVTLETREAAVASTYKAVLRVGHGCEGSPTKTVRVQIPEGVIATKPMPKAGWTLTTREADYAKAYQYYDQTLTRGVVEISWSGGELPDAWYDEFVFRARLPEGEPGTVVYFPVVQECATGVHRWIEIPEPGKSAHDYKEPAPGVILAPKPAH